MKSQISSLNIKGCTVANMFAGITEASPDFAQQIGRDSFWNFWCWNEKSSQQLSQKEIAPFIPSEFTIASEPIDETDDITYITKLSPKAARSLLKDSGYRNIEDPYNLTR